MSTMTMIMLFYADYDDDDVYEVRDVRGVYDDYDDVLLVLIIYVPAYVYAFTDACARARARVSTYTALRVSRRARSVRATIWFHARGARALQNAQFCSGRAQFRRHFQAAPRAELRARAVRVAFHRCGSARRNARVPRACRHMVSRHSSR
eukprot:7648180-Lingulodinium_polyedra.AAC.1